ncbi:glycosyltransferase family 4 protein [Turicibacter sanguinis]|uniref:glycosyltransferase family 4 protein n=1 Tax=Turicibacter sanguinis TaxID=154288 RepID=UPI0018AB38E6|nr:glycosyltransferase family 4 protein [Turicibacter sanguinis]MDB8551633.1 glycosyltransferase family 4 protein [Turicibacter sanguinis]
MKILLVSNMYPNDKYPQYGIFVKNTENILKNKNIEVEKIVLYKENRKMLKLLNYCKFYFSCFLYSIFRDFDYIYIHYVSLSSLGVILAKILKKKIVIISNTHGSDIVPESVNQKRFKIITKLTLNYSEKVIVPSEYYRELINSEYKIKYKKMYVFPSGGVNPVNFYPISKEIALSELKLSPDFKYIGYVGRIEFQKGWDVLLEAIHKIKYEFFFMNYKIIIVGNGLQKNDFLNLVKEYDLHDKIIVYDFISQDKLKYIYNSIEFLCFPTMRKGESLGLVGIEALSCGTPIIASNYAGPKDYVINNVNGFLFEKGSSESLANKIESFITLSDEEKQNLKVNALKSVIKYNLTNIEKVLLNIFDYLEEKK